MANSYIFFFLIFNLISLISYSNTLTFEYKIYLEEKNV
jgi:hypothetical protein